MVDMSDEIGLWQWLFAFRSCLDRKWGGDRGENLPWYVSTVYLTGELFALLLFRSNANPIWINRLKLPSFVFNTNTSWVCSVNKTRKISSVTYNDNYSDVINALLNSCMISNSWRVRRLRSVLRRRRRMARRNLHRYKFCGAVIRIWSFLR